MSVRRLAVAAIGVGALAAAVLPSSADTGNNPTYSSVKLRCSGGTGSLQTLTFSVTDGGKTYDSFALYAVPKHPKGLVVFDHGYQNTAYAWQDHITSTAQHDNVIAVAVDYHAQDDKGTADTAKTASSRGWRVREGADDSIWIARQFLDQCRLNDSKKVVVFGISMGGNTSGLAAAADAKRGTGKPLWNYWVDVEGATNVIETYNEASAAANAGGSTGAYAGDARDDIAQEMGGQSFEQAPDVYAAHTVDLQVPAIASSGIDGVIVVHGVADGLVPYNQTRELTTQLRALGVPVDFWSIATKTPGTKSGTTIDTDAGNTDSPFAGHAWEGSDMSGPNSYTVAVVGFERLNALLNSTGVSCTENLFDGATQTTLSSPASCGGAGASPLTRTG